jgi:hypothetical protein
LFWITRDPRQNKSAPGRLWAHPTRDVKIAS